MKEPKGSWKTPGFDQTDDHPVVGVTWKDAKAFCDWLAAKEGRRYALPTEAQWEYACRAGTATAFHFGNDPSVHGDYDWHHDNSNRSTHPVGRKKGNPWGLYDLHGNVRNWTADWYAKDYYATSPKDDPTGPAAGTARVLRGGEWDRGKNTGRAAARLSHEPTRRATTIGFRVAVVGDLKGTPPAGDKPVK